MAFDFLKKKEYVQIETLKKELDFAQTRCKELSKYECIEYIEKEKEKIFSSINAEKLEYQNIIKEYEDIIKDAKEKIELLIQEIKEKQEQIVQLDETILLQEFGLYTPVFNFTSSEEYKYKLEEIRQKEKDMILNGTAATCLIKWTVDGSKAKGRTMTDRNIKQILRCFNDECDVLVDKVKFNNVGAFIQKARKSYEALNRINESNKVSISWDYLQLKADEIKVAYEYALKKQEEKEEQKRIREQMREEAKLAKEIEEARKDIEKEQKHYSNALMKLNQQLQLCDETEKEMLIEKKQEIEKHLTDLDVAIKDIDYREANKKAGYVYVISNIGSFGEDVYKIGMTRRLDPMERVDELGDASVPFKFDVHAMIFSDDAPKLEAALHRAFEEKKVNMINNRREFFKVSLKEIEEVIKANYDKTVEFVRIPQAEQFRESIRIRASLN
jgi:hypothetical protein